MNVKTLTEICVDVTDWVPLLLLTLMFYYRADIGEEALSCRRHSAARVSNTHQLNYDVFNMNGLSCGIETNRFGSIFFFCDRKEENN